MRDYGNRFSKLETRPLRPRDIMQQGVLSAAVCCCRGCGHVGNALALSIKSTAYDAIAPKPTLACGCRAPGGGGAGFGLAAVGIAFEIDVLVFERAPQPFDEHVVHPGSAAISGDADAGRSECAGEDGAGELRPRVGVEDVRPPEVRQRLFERPHAERCIHRVDKRSTSTARLAQSMTHEVESHARSGCR